MQIYSARKSEISDSSAPNSYISKLGQKAKDLGVIIGNTYLSFRHNPLLEQKLRYLSKEIKDIVYNIAQKPKRRLVTIGTTLGAIIAIDGGRVLANKIKQPEQHNPNSVQVRTYEGKIITLSFSPDVTPEDIATIIMQNGYTLLTKDGYNAKRERDYNANKSSKRTKKPKKPKKQKKRNKVSKNKAQKTSQKGNVLDGILNGIGNMGSGVGNAVGVYLKDSANCPTLDDTLYRDKNLNLETAVYYVGHLPGCYAIAIGEPAKGATLDAFKEAMRRASIKRANEEPLMQKLYKQREEKGLENLTGPVIRFVWNSISGTFELVRDISCFTENYVWVLGEGTVVYVIDGVTYVFTNPIDAGTKTVVGVIGGKAIHRAVRGKHHAKIPASLTGEHPGKPKFPVEGHGGDI